MALQDWDKGIIGLRHTEAGSPVVVEMQKSWPRQAAVPSQTK